MKCVFKHSSAFFKVFTLLSAIPVPEPGKKREMKLLNVDLLDSLIPPKMFHWRAPLPERGDHLRESWRRTLCKMLESCVEVIVKIFLISFTYCLGLKVGRTFYSDAGFVQHVCINHCGRNIWMPQKFLHRSDIISAFQQMGRKGMALMPSSA